MWSMRVHHIGLYRRPEVHRYVSRSISIGFTVSGLVSMRLLDKDVDVPAPFFSLQPPGTEVDFCYDADRENVAILTDGDWLRPGSRPGTVLVCDGEDVVELPCFVPVAAARAPGWQDEFTRLLDAFTSPTPRNRLRVRLGVQNIIRWLLDREVDTLSASPAADLKRRIDADGTHRHSLAELSEACGFSADHLRLLFQERYGVSPNDYRLRRRLARAMDLIANSRLSAKEIAYTCGFTHSAHLSTAFRHAFGLSPRQAITQFRHPDSGAVGE